MADGARSSCAVFYYTPAAALLSSGNFAQTFALKIPKICAIFSIDILDTWCYNRLNKGKVVYIMGCLGMYQDDEFNTENRCLGNTERGDYNCGGYALGLFNWYLPYPQEMRNEISEFFGGWSYSYRKTMKIMVNYMVNTLPIRVIKSLKQLDEKTEYCVAFRLSKSDFHYVKRYQEGVWYHKMGGSYRIERMSEEEVFSKKGWIGGRYNSNIILLAIKKRQFRG